jgi:hypothetical protein
MTHDEKRYWMHVPLGLLNAAFYLYPMVGFGFTIAFLGYEAMQEWRKEDLSYKDIVGWLVGLGVGLAILIALAVIGAASLD